MSLERRLTRLPRPYDPARGTEVADTLGLASGPLCDLIIGTAGTSPFLAGVLAREAEWMADAVGDPEAAADRLLAETAQTDLPDLGAHLRQSKRRLAGLLALCDLGGVWPLEIVTQRLSDFADAAVGAAMSDALAREQKRDRLPEGTAGLFALAMGKMGAGELNYSSDIDLILLYDPASAGEPAMARAGHVKVGRALTKTLSTRTAEGYVFRTDLRLRPDAAVTPIALPVDWAEHYYESLGRTWERAAYIKARPAAGDLTAGAAFLEALRPFIWRRHLDYAAIQDAHDIRLRIRDAKGLHAAPSHLGHDLKLGRGGIREIEFFTQTRQLIAGGRDPALRLRGTVPALAALAKAGWIKTDDAETLTADYRALRETEHRVQMMHDQQTHQLPMVEEDFARLACLAGRDPDDWAQEITERFRRVSARTEGFFAPDAPATSAPELSPQAAEIVARWPSYAALRSTRATEIFARMRPGLLKRVADADRPEETLRHLDGFLSGLPAGVQLLSLFEANPQLLDLVLDICGTAPALARYLSRNAGVFDAVIAGDFFSDWPGVDALTPELIRAMGAEPDYEARLDRARTWMKEWHFRVGVHLLRGITDAEAAGHQYADLAEAVVAALWPVIVAEFAKKHGPPPGRGAAVLGMGSLGAGWLNAGSDLDIIVIYDADGAESSDGRRPLATRPYYARLTQALVTALSAPTAQGRLYEVDMRLRPSGRQGPVATALASFATYQSEEAWTWEHLALTRARPIAGDADVGADVAEVRARILAQPRDARTTRSDVGTMLRRLREAGPGPGNLKTGPGGLREVELGAAAATLLAGGAARDPLDQIAEGAQALGLAADTATLWRDAIACFRASVAARSIVAGDTATLPSGAAAFVARLAGDDETLDRMAADVAASLDMIFAPEDT